MQSIALSTPPEVALAPSYWLPSHVHICRVRDTVVFLDLKTDRYTSIQGAPVHALGSVVHGWPVEPASASGDRNALLYAEKAARSLLEKGLLTRDASHGRSAAPVSVPRGAAGIFVGMDMVRPRPIRPIDVVNFFWAWRWGQAALRALPRATEELRTLKAAHAKTDSGASEFDLDLAAGLVGAFRRLRCYAFSASGQCLLHALTLVRFLSRYSVFPTLVIGVKTMPCAAHSWVQHGDLFLDFDPGEAREYTPILTI